MIVFGEYTNKLILYSFLNQYTEEDYFLTFKKESFLYVNDFGVYIEDLTTFDKEKYYTWKDLEINLRKNKLDKQLDIKDTPTKKIKI